MPRGFTPEMKKSVGTSKPGRVNTSPPKESPGAPVGNVARAPAVNGGGGGGGGAPRPMNTVQHAQLPQAPRQGLPPDTPHVAAATSIAHAILARRGGM